MEIVFMILLTLASVWVGVFCILEIIDAFQSFSFEKYMRHRRANKEIIEYMLTIVCYC